MRINTNMFKYWNKNKSEMVFLNITDLAKLEENINIMQNIGVMTYRIGVDQNAPDSDVEWIYEEDIVKLIYEDSIKGSSLEAYGIITELRDGSFMIDFPQYGTTTGIPYDDDYESLLLIGNIWDKESWKNIEDGELVKIITEWMKDLI